MTSFPRLSGHYMKDPLGFHPTQRPAKLNCIERETGTKKKGKGYQHQPHSGSSCSSQWPALQVTPAAFSTKETNCQQGSPADFTGFCLNVFSFTDASCLSPFQVPLLPFCPTTAWAQELPGGQPQSLWLSKCKRRPISWSRKIWAVGDKGQSFSISLGILVLGVLL